MISRSYWPPAAFAAGFASASFFLCSSTHQPSNDQRGLTTGEKPHVCLTRCLHIRVPGAPDRRPGEEARKSPSLFIG
ncbi:hypothetical protein N656DRAFT_356465 [Canariomyces notabilis]|uniref:Uncharacterized protein n=1 Tax=Canariomyces notabilis TaxID=2074819 RepID=A0AAN6QF97_9PEZI|nr:hypothetical protein N656DRAFT_356465 [Canariomyces arenarius]